MKTTCVLVVSLVLALGCGRGVAAAEDRSVTLDTIVVTAEKSETSLQTGDVDTRETPAAVVVIEREAFEGKMEGLDEIIEKETGIQVRQTGGLGSFSSVSLRGSTSDQVLVYLDGVLLNDAAGGGVDLSRISLSDVAAIEIYKGTTPVNYGKSAIGGVVNIKTIRSREGCNVNAGVGYGSFNTRRLNALVNHKPGRFDYLISAESLASDNDYEIENDNGTPDNPADDRDEDRNNAAFEQINLLGKGGYDLSQRCRLDFVHQYFSKDQELPSWNNAAATDTTLATDRHITTLKVTTDGIGGLSLNNASFVDYAVKEEEYDDSKGDIGLGRQKIRYRTSRYGVNSFFEWLFAWHTASLSLDLHDETYETEDLIKEIDADASRRRSFSSGLQERIYLFEDRLTVSPAVRYTRIEDDLTSLVDAWGIQEEDVSRTSEAWSPQIGVRYQALDWLYFKSNLGRYHREPHFYELSGDRGYLIGNPDLENEQGTNFDLGAAVEARAVRPWLDRLSVSATYYRNEVDDLITTVYDARGIGRTVNVPGARIEGVELGLTAEGFGFLRLIGNATLQDTENLNENKAFNGKELPGRWKRAYRVRAEARYRGFKCYTEYLLSKDLYYDTANLLPAEDKKELNAGISWLAGRFLFSFDGKNLQNNQYEDFNGYPLPGRSFFGSVTYRY